MAFWKEQHLITAVFALSIFRVQFRAVLYHICRIFMQNLHTESMECSLPGKLFASAIYYTPSFPWAHVAERIWVSWENRCAESKEQNACVQGKRKIPVSNEMHNAVLPLGPSKLTFCQERIKAQIPRPIFTSSSRGASVLSLLGKTFKGSLKPFRWIVLQVIHKFTLFVGTRREFTW